MASRGNVVQEVLREALIPARRPIDHARRIGTGAFLGSLGGAVLGIVAIHVPLSARTAILIVAVLLAFGALCLLPWVIEPKAGQAGHEVVARVLGTNETAEARRVRGGRGIYVPVVCRPVEEEGETALRTGRGDFRSVVVVPASIGADGRLDDVPPGTLLPLLQVEEGMGELANMPGEASERQREVMAYLQAHPKSLKNTAPVLPLRRGPLERVPAWAAAEFWANAILGASVALLIVATLAR